MPHPRQARLLASLPEPIRDLFNGARAKTKNKSWHERDRLISELLAAIGYRTEERPRHKYQLYPLASSLTATQRTVMELLAMAEPFMGGDMPWGRVARRWLGLEPPGELEKPAKRPLWRAISVACRNPGDVRKAAALLDREPMPRRLVACSELLHYGAYDIPGESIFDCGGLHLLDELRAEGRDWAPKAADELLDPDQFTNARLKLLVFLALARAGVAIEPRWERLLPIDESVAMMPRRYLFECIEAIAPQRRSMAILAAVSRLQRFDVKAVLALFERYPSGRLFTSLAKKLGKSAELFAARERAGKKHPELIAATRATVGARRQPPVLHCARVSTPRSVDELSPVRRKQLVECGRRYDREKLSAAVRLGTGDYDSTGSFRGFVSLWEIADADGKPAYDAWRCMVDSGTVFRAGTTKVAAEIVQFGAESRDPLLEQALDAVLSKRPPKPRSKKPGATKRAAKKGA